MLFILYKNALKTTHTVIMRCQDFDASTKWQANLALVGLGML